MTNTDPHPPAEPVAKPPQFRPDQAAFMRRLAEGKARDRETALIVKAHLTAGENRIASALVEIGGDKPHLGLANSFLELGLRDFEAARKALQIAMARPVSTLSPTRGQPSPPIKGEQRCQAVASNGEGKVPTTAPASPATPLGSNTAPEVGAQAPHLPEGL